MFFPVPGMRMGLVVGGGCSLFKEPRPSATLPLQCKSFLSPTNSPQGIHPKANHILVGGSCPTTPIQLPDTTPWLSKEQQRYAVWCLAQEAAGELDDRYAISPMQAVKMACKDYKLYLFMVVHHCNLLSQSFT